VPFHRAGSAATSAAVGASVPLIGNPSGLNGETTTSPTFGTAGAAYPAGPAAGLAAVFPADAAPGKFLSPDRLRLAVTCRASSNADKKLALLDLALFPCIDGVCAVAPPSVTALIRKIISDASTRLLQTTCQQPRNVAS